MKTDAIVHNHEALTAAVLHVLRLRELQRKKQSHWVRPSGKAIIGSEQKDVVAPQES